MEYTGLQLIHVWPINMDNCIISRILWLLHISKQFKFIYVKDNSFNRVNPVIDNEVIEQTVTEARQQVDSVINNTLRDLYDRSKTRTPSDLLALFR